MKVIITAGGTGGHIYPAIAIIEKIKEKEPNSEFIYIGTTNRMEKDIIPAMGIKYIGIEMMGLSKNILKDIKVACLVLSNISKCKDIIKGFKPDVVLGIGGYVSYPVLKAAKGLHVKTFIHEQNSIPGKSNKMLGKLADKIGVSFASSAHYFDEKKVVFTGNPCSERALTTPRISKEKFGLHKDKKFVLMVQGSLGSTSVNDKMKEFLSTIDDTDYEVIYITGKASYDDFIKNKFSKNVFVKPYIENLAGLIKEADLVISRAGASSISEIIALDKMSILIPSPYVANNHQYYNALDVVNSGASVMIEETNLNSTILKENIDKLLHDAKVQTEMKSKIKEMQKNNSSTIIYDTLKDLIK